MKRYIPLNRQLNLPLFSTRHLVVVVSWRLLMSGWDVDIC